MEEIRGLQLAELGILVDIDRFCREHGITYFLGEGTLLGAVRHQGFIPWDDDIDILMKREDYRRFLEIAPSSLGDRYEVQHSTTVRNYWSPFIKVRLLKGGEAYRQQHIAHLTDHNGPCVDIFPLDYVPRRSSAGQKLQSINIRFLRGMLSLKLGLRRPKNLKQRVLRIISVFYTVDGIHRQLERAFSKYHSRGPSDWIASLATYQKLSSQVVPAQVYEKPVPIEFEGHEMFAPCEFDYLLRHIYGDYMQLPPIEKQTIKHHFRHGGH